MTSTPVSFSTGGWTDLLGVSPPSSWPTEISGIQADSRFIRPGQLFVAIPGTHSDGHLHIGDAVKRGAAGIVAQKPPSHSLPVPVVTVPSSRTALADISRAFHGYPDRALSLVGVTGTNGKTSVTRFVRYFLQGDGGKAGSLGTVGYSFAGRELPARRTTPSGPELHRLLQEMHRAGCGSCVMEVSSHALDQQRVHGLEFDTVVFTNLSQDHLDYHHTMEAYFEAKAKLFSMPGIQTRIVGEDAWSMQLAERFGPDVLRCGLGQGCDVRAEHVETSLAGTVAALRTPWGDGTLRIPLPGIHNLRNVLQAVAVAASSGVDIPSLLVLAERLKSAPGRMQLIPGKTGRVYVDYAHTPEALESVLSLVKGLARGRVKVVFGCGGDRDRTKRPLMVQAAGKWADEIILTTDNPRTEEPDQIFADMKTGVSSGMSVRTEADRKEAIRSAVYELQTGDVLIIAGKGHETIQEVGALQIPFDDREVAGHLLAERDGKTSGEGTCA